MMKALVLAIALTVSGCDLFGSSTKVAHGQRYQSDDSRFDPYFDSVHQQQVSAAAWLDEKKAARKPLIDALTLPPNATDDAIVTATRTRAKGGGGGKLDVATAHVTPIGTADPPLFAAVEESVRLELDRARKRRATATQLEELAKKGEENKRTADREYENRGVEKADAKKSDAKMELRRELGAAVTAMRDMEDDANKDAQSGQDFLEDIGDALEAADPPKKRPSKALPPPASAPTTASAPPPADPKPAKPSKSKPSSPPATPKPAAPPPDKPKPPPDDVFNP